MTASEWRDHAAQCRFLAQTIEEASARRILLEAADDYLATAEREQMLEKRGFPTHSRTASANGVTVSS